MVSMGSVGERVLGISECVLKEEKSFMEEGLGGGVLCIGIVEV